MMERNMRIAWRRRALVAVGLLLGGLLAWPAPASARVWFGFGFPLVVGPPAYYPPPAYYYPPPPAYYGAPPAYYGAPQPPPYAQPGAQYAPSSQSCQTGGAVCPMEHPVTSGSSCYCTTEQGRVWGRAT